jgi:hypothetical protein
MATNMDSIEQFINQKLQQEMNKMHQKQQQKIHDLTKRVNPYLYSLR